MFVFSAVVANEKLVGEQGAENLGAVVVQATVPGSLVKLECGFEPFVERLGGSASPRIVKPGCLRLEVVLKY